MWWYVSYMITCGIVKCHVDTNSLNTLHPAPYILVALLWLMTLYETMKCNEYKYITNMGTITYAQDFLDCLRTSAPELRFVAECYHYETKNGEFLRRTLKETQSIGPKFIKKRLPTLILKIILIRFMRTYPQTVSIGSVLKE